MSDGFVFVFSSAALPMLAAAAAAFVLGIFVLGRERAGIVSLSFLGITITISLWLTAFAVAASSRDEETAVVFMRLAYVGVALIPAAVLQFTAALLGGARRWRVWLTTTWACAGAFVILFTMTPILLAGARHYRWGFYPHLTPASSAFLVFFAAVLGASLVLLAKTHAQSAQEQRRNAAFFTALAIGYLGSIDYLPAFGMAMFPIGCLAIAAFVVLSARSIMRFRLTDLSPSAVADHLLRAMHGGAIVVDARGTVQVVNEAAAQLLGSSSGEVRRADLRRLLGVGLLPLTDSESFFRRAAARQRVVSWKRGDGSEIELSVSAVAIRDDDDHVVGILYTLADGSDRRRANENEYRATHDVLTTLPNRVHFSESFAETAERIVASDRIPALLFLDLDGFKAVNDEWGHDTGDALLRLISIRLRNAIRGEDLLARYGGDEFVLLLDLARAEDATLVIDKLVRVVKQAYDVHNRRVSVGASIGPAFYPADGTTAEELIRVADAAMYAAKRAGKGQLHVKTDAPAPPIVNIDVRV